jgi:hypothetical protein
MSDEVRNVTLEYAVAEQAAEQFNPGEQVDIAKLMRSAYMHGYADALLGRFRCGCKLGVTPCPHMRATGNSKG